MVDPISWTLLGSSALTEGIKFLYGQAAELIKQHREGKHDASSPVVAPTGVFVGDPVVCVPASQQPPDVDELRKARLDLGEYVDGILPVDARDAELFKRIATLRALLEGASGASFTFVGEERTQTAELFSRLVVDTIEGKATGMRIKELSSGTATSEAKVGRIEPGGEYVGLEIDTVGRANRASGSEA